MDFELTFFGVKNDFFVEKVCNFQVLQGEGLNVLSILMMTLMDSTGGSNFVM